MASALALANPSAAYAGLYLNCKVPIKPAVKVDLTSDEIKYDFSTSASDLLPVKSGALAAAKAYPAGTDTVTSGLRWDRPSSGFEIETGSAELTQTHQSCVWYSSVDVKIKLSPYIYIAKEFSAQGPCRDAIMAHELHHVDVDREMMNKYSQIIGEAVQKVVSETGSLGPVNSDKLEEARADLNQRVKTAIKTAEEPLRAEMESRQAQVDSPEEYRRVSAICNAQLSPPPAPHVEAIPVQPPAAPPQATAVVQAPPPSSPSEIQILMDKAAKGDHAAQTSLGMKYHAGQEVPQNDVEALRWITKAAVAGYAPAQANLGYMYYNGIAVQKSAADAVSWYSQAAAQGYAPAKQSLDGIKKEQGAMP